MFNKEKRWDRFNLTNFAEFSDVKLENSNATYSDKELFSFVELDEFKSEHLTNEPYSYWKSVGRAFIKKPSAIIAILSLLILVAGAAIIPFFTPDGYLLTNIDLINAKPSAEHLWGCDIAGRDLFFGTWQAARKSVILAMISSTIIIIVGTIIGLIWGFFRRTDPFFVELYNLISNIPALLIYMLLAYIIGQSLTWIPVEAKLIIALTLTSWIGLARFIRNQTIIITNREYNIASKTLGTPASRIMTRNLLPYLLAVIITQASLLIPAMISSEVAMSYFGVGLPQNAISIGALLNAGRTYFEQYPWQLLAPAGVLSFIIFTFFLLGLALTDALDPKKHR